MSKLVQKLIRTEGRGVFAPAFPRPKNLLERLPRPASGGSLFAGAGVLAAVVVVVSLLTWLAPNSDRPVPLDLVDRVLPGAAEQIEEHAATLIEGGEEAARSVARSVVRNVREGVLGEGLRAARDGISGSSLSALFLAVLPTPSSTPSSSPSSEEPSAPSQPSLPAMDRSLPAAPSEPVAPPPVAEETPPPAAEEPAPPVEEPAPPVEEPAPPPAAEESPITETPPPPTGEPSTGAPG